jgi:membrane protease subunit HflK
LRKVVGEMRIDDILTSAKPRVLEKTKLLTQASLDDWDSGISMVGVQLLQAEPPAEVMEAFRDVASAREDRETYINEAYGYRNSVIPEAQGEAAKTIMEAEGIRAERINYAQGEASRFLLQHKEHKKARDVTESRLYIETMEKALPPVEKILINPEVKQGLLDLWFLSEDGKKLIVD